MKHLIRTTILMLAILLPVIAHASQPLAEGQGDDVTLPDVPEITINTFDDYVSLGASAVEGATVVFYQCDDENGTNPRVIENPTNFNREAENYDVFVYAVASNDAGETSSVVTKVVIPAKYTYPDPFNPPDYTEGHPGQFMLDGIYYYRIGNNNVSVTYGLTYNSFNHYSGDIIIPETIVYGGKTYSVSAIEASAFRDCSGLTSVNIPNSVTSIGHHAFSNCSGLANITIPNSVTSIGHHAFYNCSGLTNIAIPDSVTSIGYQALDGSAWYNNLPDGEVVYAGLIAYKYKGTMPYGTNLTLKDGTRSISNYAFSGCSGLTSLTIPNSVTSIGSSAFQDCTGLTSISIGDSVTSIGYFAFEGCTSLMSITIPSSVTDIGGLVFYSCTELSTIIVDSGNPVFDSRDNCNAIVKTSENEIIAGCKGTVIPNSVTSIKGQEIEWAQSNDGYGWYCYHVGYGAFEGIDMDSLIIPISITNIGHGAFRGSHIKMLYFNSSYHGWEDYSPHAYPDNYCYPLEGCQADVFIIGNNLRSISYTLTRNASFSSIVIPNTVEYYYEWSSCPFAYVEGLSSFYIIGEGEWKAGHLMEDAYYDYDNNCYINKSIANLYIDAGFTSVKGMHVPPIDVYCYATVPPQCDGESFTDYSGTLHVPATSIASYFTAPYWCNFANIVGDIEGPNSIALNEDSIEIKVGKTFNLTATLDPSNTDHDLFTMWQSGDATIATIDFGLVTAVAEGECDITVSCLGKKAICHVTVVSPISLSLDKNDVTIEKNDSTTLTATILPESESGLPITWTSSNTEVAIVDNGLVIAVEEGECDITATCLGTKAVCHVIVIKPIITITLDQDTVMVLPNHIISLTPSATPVMPDNFTASSSDPTVAAPRIMNGEVQVVGIKEGTATITVGSADGPTVPATCLVTVYTEPGDVNCDGFRNISDVTSLINYLLSGDDSSIKVENADLNIDGKVAIGDVTALISGLLSGEWPSMETDDHEWVDLGLPSGTLWATCNVGANTPEEFGDYFAWGETTPRDFYDWSAGSSTTMTKYCTSSSYGYEGFTDGKTELDLEDDAAYVNWGKKWRMPTYEQHTELYTQCTWTWTTQNGVKGYLVTGPNGNTMFVPAAGYHSERAHYSAGTEGRYWLSTLYSDRADHSYCLYFNSGSVSWDDSRRYRGFSVRAVRVSQH